MTAEQQALVLQNMRLAKWMARPYIAACGDDHALGDDLMQEAFLALSQAAAAFDPSRGVKFATFASRRIAGSFVDVLRLRGREVALVDAATAGDAPADRFDLSDQVDDVLRRLSSRKATILRLIYLEGMSQADACGRMRISKAMGSRLHAEAIRFARQRFARGEV